MANLVDCEIAGMDAKRDITGILIGASAAALLLLSTTEM